jgi:hypothetical protein
MRKKIVVFFICILLIFSTTSFALTPIYKHEQKMNDQLIDEPIVKLSTSNRWIKTFGGSGWDEGRSVLQNSNGCYIILGKTSYGAGDGDVWLIKTDIYGNELWNRTFGGSKEEYGYCVKQTSDGCYIIAASTLSFGSGDYDAWLIKTDDDGNKIWDKTFGGINVDKGTFVQQTTDGGYILTGYTESFSDNESDIWLIKTNSVGIEEWNRTFGGIDSDFGWAVQQTTDGGYIIMGLYKISYMIAANFWLIKTDSNGYELWNKTDFCLNGACSGQQTTDDGYIIGGWTDRNHFRGDAWLYKTDANGDKIWERTYGGGDSDYGYSVKQTADGGYIITGETNSYCRKWRDVWLIKTDFYGNELWNRTFGGSFRDYGISVQQTTDGGYIITGYTDEYGDAYRDVLLIKTDNQGLVGEKPDKPTITGESSGKPDIVYNYTFMSTDPEEDEISYFIDWDDNSTTGWTESLPSGEYYNFSHNWSKKGNYIIKAKAKDVYGGESDWATLEVTIPKIHVHNTIIDLLIRMLECFPLFQKILKQFI